ncbi:MAG: hypothetical protein HY097_04060 [Nitrospinae bacterium]|nr:hypothetical protein [Nitrospinota bacterium]
MRLVGWDGGKVCNSSNFFLFEDGYKGKEVIAGQKPDRTQMTRIGRMDTEIRSKKSEARSQKKSCLLPLAS